VNSLQARNANQREENRYDDKVAWVFGYHDAQFVEEFFQQIVDAIYTHHGCWCLKRKRKRRGKKKQIHIEKQLIEAAW